MTLDGREGLTEEVLRMALLNEEFLTEEKLEEDAPMLGEEDKEWAEA